MSVTITLRENGPVVVEGDFVLQTHDGTKIETTPGKVVLCRCGQSAKKPFCDSAHKRCGFVGTSEPAAA